MSGSTLGKPELTKDLRQAKLDLDVHGYCLVAEALTPEEIRENLQRLEEQAEAEAAAGLAYRDGGESQKYFAGGKLKSNAFSVENGGVNQRIWQLVNKGRCFRDLVIHPVVEELVGHVLGSDYLLSAHTANIAHPGGVRMGLHTDQWWMPQPYKPAAGEQCTRPSEISRNPSEQFVNPDQALGIAPAVCCNTMWMLNDFGLDNGSTEVVPGSHLSGAHPDPRNQDDYNIVQPVAPAGTCMVFDGRLWHGTGANIGTRKRFGVLALFCAPQFRQQENQVIGLDPNLWDDIPQHLKDRLGFKTWNVYGRVESPATERISLNPDLIGELKP